MEIISAVSDFYENKFQECILITGDGDFGCLVEFLKKRDAIKEIIAPNESNCSILLKNKNVPIMFLNDHYHKFSRMLPRSK
jgi:hypothetical protein